MFTTLKSIYVDVVQLYGDVRKQDFGFWCVVLYLVFTYMKPQVTFPELAFLPWVQLTIVAGFFYALLKGQLSVQIAHVGYATFCVIIFISCINAAYPEISWSKFDFVYIPLIELIFFTSCIKNIQQFKMMMVVLIIILFKMSLFGAKTWVSRGFGFTSWGIAGPTGLFSNSGEFSLLMAVYAMLALGFISGHLGTKKIYYITVITAVMTVMGASSRGSQLALLIGLFLVGFLLGKFKLKNILLAVVVIWLGIQLLPEEQKARFQSMGEDDTSQSRLTYWSAGLDMMNKNKLSGIGYFNFAEYYHNHYKDLSVDSGYLAQRREVAHNSLVETGSELGYPGLLCYLWLHFICFRLNRGASKLSAGVVSLGWVPRFTMCANLALVVYFIGAFFMSVAYYPYIYLLLMISQALFTNCKKLKELSK